MSDKVFTAEQPPLSANWFWEGKLFPMLWDVDTSTAEKKCLDLKKCLSSTTTSLFHHVLLISTSHQFFSNTEILCLLIILSYILFWQSYMLNKSGFSKGRLCRKVCCTRLHSGKPPAAFKIWYGFFRDVVV